MIYKNIYFLTLGGTGNSFDGLDFNSIANQKNPFNNEKNQY